MPTKEERLAKKLEKTQDQLSKLKKEKQELATELRRAQRRYTKAAEILLEHKAKIRELEDTLVGVSQYTSKIDKQAEIWFTDLLKTIKRDTSEIGKEVRTRLTTILQTIRRSDRKKEKTTRKGIS